VNSRAKNYLIILLAFATATAGTIAWRQNQLLKTLQADLLAAKSSPAPHKTMTAKPQASIAAVADAKPTASDPAIEPADATANQQTRQQRNNRPNFAALMANPEFARAWNIERRAQLDSRYANLFKSLNLSPSQLDGLKNLLVERESAAMDVTATAREQGLDPRTDRDAINKLIASAQSDVDQSIKAALGDTGYQQYQNYQATQPQRAVVAQLEQRLSYSATPLTGAQSDFLVQALGGQSSVASALTTDQGGRNGGFGGRGGNGTPISDVVIKQAQNILTPDQVTALKEIQAQQQAQQKVRELMRANDGNTTATRKSN
jgi:hypothetical protein